jgi:hypothetical protein
MDINVTNEQVLIDNMVIELQESIWNCYVGDHGDKDLSILKLERYVYELIYERKPTKDNLVADILCPENKHVAKRARRLLNLEELHDKYYC